MFVAASAGVFAFSVLRACVFCIMFGSLRVLRVLQVLGRCVLVLGVFGVCLKVLGASQRGVFLRVSLLMARLRWSVCGGRI